MTSFPLSAAILDGVIQDGDQKRKFPPQHGGMSWMISFPVAASWMTPFKMTPSKITKRDMTSVRRPDSMPSISTNQKRHTCHCHCMPCHCTIQRWQPQRCCTILPRDCTMRSRCRIIKMATCIRIVAPTSHVIAQYHRDRGNFKMEAPIWRDSSCISR